MMKDKKQKDKERKDEQLYKLVDLKFICENARLSRAFIYKLMSNNVFPKPLKLGRSSRWYLSEYLEWLNNQRSK